jgi:HEPN domain-containing protein
MKRLTAEWVQKAEEDYRTAELIARSHEPLHDQLCFHCQQSAEKYLKALLEELGLDVPRTDNLVALTHSFCLTSVP